ncbi:MAG: AI-2E family transporter [Clostridia bacterium]|nr:AI-2E family transporter [Clostridia bacterium]
MKLNWKHCAMLGVTVFGVFVAIKLWPAALTLLGGILGAVSPLFAGFAVAYVVNILMSKYEKIIFPRAKSARAKKLARVLCMVLAFVTFAAVVALVIMLVVPQLWDCVTLLVNELPDAIRACIAWVERFHILPEDIIATLEKIDWRSRVSEIINAVTSGIGSVMNVAISVVTSVFSAVVSAFLAIIFAIYLLLDRDGLKLRFSRAARRYTSEKTYNKAAYVIGEANDCFRRYIIGQCTEAVILGLLCTLGMFILRLPYATMIGALVAFTALIPVAGAYIGAAVGAFMILTVSPVKALIFIVFLVILQQFEGNVIYPRVVGSSMGLPGIWVLAAVTVGGGIMGIAGMLLGVPLAATAYRLISRDVRRWEEEQEPRAEEKREAEKVPEIIVSSDPKPSADVPKPKKQKKGKKK